MFFEQSMILDGAEEFRVKEYILRHRNVRLLWKLFLFVMVKLI